MNRYLLLLAGGALLVAGGGAWVKRSQDAERVAGRLPAPALPGKASERVAATANKAAAWRTSPQAAKEYIRRWLDDLHDQDVSANGPELSADVLAACKILNAAMVEELLRSPELRWLPEYWNRGDSGDPLNACLFPLQAALLERWGALDPDALQRIHLAPDAGEEEKEVLAAFFKGAASKDGARAIELLSGWLATESPGDENYFMGPLVEGWAGSDPEAAWRWVSSTRHSRPGWGQAAHGFFAGLEQPEWERYPERIESITQRFVGGATPAGKLREELAKRWICDDAVAALDYHGGTSGKYTINLYNLEMVLRGVDKKVVLLSELVGPWLSNDPQAGEKFRAALGQTQSRYRGVEPDEVFAAIAGNVEASDELREIAKGLIQDAEAVARREEERKAKLLAEAAGREDVQGRKE